MLSSNLTRCLQVVTFQNSACTCIGEYPIKVYTMDTTEALCGSENQLHHCDIEEGKNNSDNHNLNNIVLNNILT